MKLLHPDVHPNPTPKEKELLNRAIEAYDKGDLETIQKIWDEAQELSVLTRNPMIRMQDSLRPHLKNTTADFPFSVSLLYDSNEETSQGNKQKCR